MSSSLGLRIFLAVSIPLTVSLKVLAAQPADLRPTELLEARLGEFLTRSGFAVERLEVQNRTFIGATLDDCRLLVLEATPEGYTGDALQVDRADWGTAQDDRVVFVFDGRVYQEQPTGRTLLADLWGRFQRRLGVDSPWTPIFVVRASRACPIEELPWREIARVD